MPLRMWSYDLAREQAPTEEHLRSMLAMTRRAGYTAFGLYMEHRFAYPSTPWAHGVGCVAPETIKRLVQEFPDIQIIPFVNLLGHFEGMLYTEEGKRYREQTFQGMQACPSNPDFVRLCEALLDDVLEAFPSEIVHIGGDETWQLGACPRCAKAFDGSDPKAALYASHFGSLARRLLDRGRRPAIWGDMFLDHPSALESMPKEALIFDWQYFQRAIETSRRFMDAGFEVVCCPTIHNYNAIWMHVDQSEANVRQLSEDAREIGAAGVCVTTWENGLFGSYDTLMPALEACAAILVGNDSEEGAFLGAYRRVSDGHAEWARLMGSELQGAGGVFAFSGTRSALKVRLLLNSNPFLAWMHHSDELCGQVGDAALSVIEEALLVAPDEATKGISLFARSAIEFVRLAEASRREYADGRPEAAITRLLPTRQIFADLETAALRTHTRCGGSLADVERCRAARDHIDRVMARIRRYGDRSLGYLPSFEHLTHHKFMPHDQGAWWLINRWSNE